MASYDLSNDSTFEILITNGFQEWYIPKVTMMWVVDEPYITIYWIDNWKGGTEKRRQTPPLDYQDIFVGYAGFASAQDVANRIEVYRVTSFGGGASWGSINGTLSDQTDLQAALDAKLDLPTGTPDGTKYLRDDNSWQPIAFSNGSTAIPVFTRAVYAQMGAATITGMLAAAAFLNNTNRSIWQDDFTGYSQVKITARITTASVGATPLFIVRYKTGAFSTTVSDYSTDIGTSAVQINVGSNGIVSSGWVNLAAGAKASVYYTVITSGGNGAGDNPVFGGVDIQFR